MTTGTVEVDGATLVYDRFGEGEPVLVIAGLGMPALLWHETLVPPLVADGHEVITFDNRGVPPSDSPAAPYSIDGFVADAVAVIEQLELGAPRVIGYSMGGCIAQELTLARPDLVRAAVLIGTRARHTAYTVANFAGQLDLFRACPDTPGSFFVPYLLGCLLSPAQQLDDDIVRSFLGPMLDAPPWTDPGRVNQYQAYLDYGDRLDALTAITRPCAVISFDDDLLVPAAFGREVADAIPGATYHAVPDQGHYGVLLAVDAVMEIVRPHFASL